MKKIVLIVFLTACYISNFAQTYPFDLPAKVTATLNVDTTHSEVFNYKLLGTNYHRFASEDEQNLFRKFNQNSIRFPDGVWSNFYDWRCDGGRRYGDLTYKNSTYGGTIAQWTKNQWTYGFSGMTKLHNEKNFDILWTYALNYEESQSPEQSVARMLDSQSKGYIVDNIELGNELYFQDQTSPEIDTPEKILVKSKALADALHKANPSVKIGLPLSCLQWRSQIKFNKILTSDQTYFDAISHHRYFDYDRDSAVISQQAYKSILTCRLDFIKDDVFVRSFAPGKPIWLSEWGVSCGKGKGESKAKAYPAAACLAQADIYLHLFDNQNTYERANWFEVRATHNPLYIINGTGASQVVRRTGFGSVYEIMRSAFDNSLTYKGKMTTSELLPGSNAVEAKASKKDGKIIVTAVNKTNKTVAFNLLFNDKAYKLTFKHETLAFDSLNEIRIVDFDEKPLKLIKSGAGVISLPPYSVNKISEICINSKQSKQTKKK